MVGFVWRNTRQLVAHEPTKVASRRESVPQRYHFSALRTQLLQGCDQGTRRQRNDAMTHNERCAGTRGSLAATPTAPLAVLRLVSASATEDVTAGAFDDSMMA